VSSSPCGLYIATWGIGSDVMCWDVRSGKMLINLSGHEAPVKSVSFGAGEGGGNESEKIVLVSGDTEGVIILWRCHNKEENDESDENDEVEIENETETEIKNSHTTTSAMGWTREEILTWHHHKVPIRSASFCGSNDNVVSCDATGKVLIVDSKTGEIQTEFVGGGLSCSAWAYWNKTAESNEYLLVTASLNTMIVWNTKVSE